MIPIPHQATLPDLKEDVTAPQLIATIDATLAVPDSKG